MKYDIFRPQLYLKALRKKEVSILFKIRSQVLGIKANEKFLYQNDMSCRLCGLVEENLSHVFTCTKLQSRKSNYWNKEILFQDITESNITEVKEHLQVVQQFMDEVTRMVDEN